MDVIVADLDGGSIRVPESLTLSLLPEPYWKNLHGALSLVSFLSSLREALTTERLPPPDPALPLPPLLPSQSGSATRTGTVRTGGLPLLRGLPGPPEHLLVERPRPGAQQAQGPGAGP